MSQPDLANLRSSLLAALAYFDQFDFPLTLAELCRLRYDPDGQAGPATTDAVCQALTEAPVEQEEGYWFLPGRQDTVRARRRRYRLAEKKFRRAVWAARFMRLLPSVRLIAVCNSLAMANSEPEGDIDLFVVSRPGTLWITRLIVAGVMQLLRLRPTRTCHADRFCLSFFVAEDALDLSRLALGPDDVYLHFWMATLRPLYDAGGVLESFFRANAWVRCRLPGLAADCGVARRTVRGTGRSGLGLRLLRRLDAWSRRVQLKRLPPGLREIANLDSRVVVSPQILKFHLNDRRAQYGRAFRDRLQRLGLPT